MRTAKAIADATHGLITAAGHRWEVKPNSIFPDMVLAQLTIAVPASQRWVVLSLNVRVSDLGVWSLIQEWPNTPLGDLANDLLWLAAAMAKVPATP